MEDIIKLIRELDLVLNEGSGIDRFIAVAALNQLIQKHSQTPYMAAHDSSRPVFNDPNTICAPSPFDCNR